MANEILEYGRVYHIYNRGNNSERLFIQRDNYPFFLQRYAKYIQPVAETYAYCLLPNHFHFAIRTFTLPEQKMYWQKEIGPIFNTDEEIGPIFKPLHPSRAFNNLFIAYARAFNKLNGRTGALFESPFHRKPVDDSHYLRTLITYIHRNPQRHGYVADFREWSWSSYHSLHRNGPTHLPRKRVLNMFDGRTAFNAAHQTPIEDEQFTPLLLDDWFGY